MIIPAKHREIEIRNEKATYRFCGTGDIAELLWDSFRLNCFEGTPAEGSAANIWLRLHQVDGRKEVYPLWGRDAAGCLYKNENKLLLQGSAGEVEYTLAFAPMENGWLWKLRLAPGSYTCDLLYGQDVGVADRGGVLTNELYMAQYLGHSVFEGENGCTVVSRQNQPQSQGRFPVVQQGMLGAKAVAYSTDALQFFGLEYKAGSPPAAVQHGLPGKVKQGELSYIGLQSETLAGDEGVEVGFYALVCEDSPLAVEKPMETGGAEQAWRRCKTEPQGMQQVERPRRNQEFAGLYTSPEWPEEEINQRWPQRRLEERDAQGRLLSFFIQDHTHVVLQAKERRCERPHGHIIISCPAKEAVSSEVITSTNYMYGLFNGQVAIGNTSAHKLISTPRGLLNQLKNHGQRIWVKWSEEWVLLGLPAVYELGLNWARWHYSLPAGESLVVTVFTCADSPDIVLEASCSQPVEFLVTSQLVMGDQEFEQPVVVNRTESGVDVEFSDMAMEAVPYKKLKYTIQVQQGQAELSDDRVFFADGLPRNTTLLTHRFEKRQQVRMLIHGVLEQERLVPPEPDFAAEKEKAGEYYEAICAGVQLSLDTEDEQTAGELEKINTILRWYSHNAMIHFASPHGLEQPGGAAWGTRDVCQGPFELFMTTGNWAMVRKILLNLFAHQSKTTGEWPQWFMYDRYTLNAGECHGDVVFWPLKCIGEYLLATGDEEILQEKLPWLDSEDKAGLIDHVRLAAEQYEQRFVPGTKLLSYAGGDWDDTLQPADEKQKKQLISAWTQALGIQAAETLAAAFEKYDAVFAGRMQQTAVCMAADFEKYLLLDGVIAGFAKREEDGSFTPLLHPRDEVTGIQYRLLPHTRTVIAGMVSREQADANMKLVDDHLLCPDGARLMNRPAAYNGGVSRLFRRAEQAANVGREIGLQYVHAHIRYIEALAKMGKGEEAWKAAFTINPILLGKAVPNAEIRQSNAYFSSSDADVNTRMEFAARFEELFAGTLQVKGGWRIYSSGPGIYLHQLVGNILGLRMEKEHLLIDPVLPAKLDGLRCRLRVGGELKTFVYHVGGEIQATGVSLEASNIQQVDNPYREGGVRLPLEAIKNTQVVEIYCPAR